MRHSRLADRIVRYAALVPCYNAFIDTRTPGSDAKENFTIIGPGVSENPAQYVHITEPHGFNIGGARQPPRCVNSQHSHDTAETFVVHSGTWRFTFGEHGDDAAVEAQAGDLVSFPTRTFRGFTNIGDDVGFLWAVLGGDDPGHVTWAPRVFEMARDYGLVLLENGALVDTLAGEALPADVAPMRPTSASDVAMLDRVEQAVADTMIVRSGWWGDAADDAGDKLVRQVALIGAAAPAEGMAAGRFPWPHGYSVRKVRLAPGAAIAPHRRAAPEVVFAHRGTLTVDIDGDRDVMGEGDTLTVPVGARRSYSSDAGALLFIVHGGDVAAAPDYD